MLRFVAIVVCAALVAAATSAVAQPVPSLDDQLKLAAHGGLTLSVPRWKRTRADDSVAVLEQVPAAEADAGFYVLTVVAEQGPAKVDLIDWQTVVDNIIAAAREAGTTVELQMVGGWNGVPGFKAQRMLGSLTVKDKTLSLLVIALAREGVLVTVSIVTAKASRTAPQIVKAVAGSLKAGG